MPESFSGIEEHGYRVTWKLSPSELRQVHALRADVFCRELGWVGAADEASEWDEFDARSIHIAVLDGGSRVVAAVRLISSAAPWMLDTVFRELAPPELVVKKVDALEASRLSVSRATRNARLGNARRVCDLLYKGTYVYSAVNAIRNVYMVTSDVVLRHMRQAGLPCEPLAAPTRMADGVNALAVKLDWKQLSRNPALSDWYEAGWRTSRARAALEESRGNLVARDLGWIKAPDAESEKLRAPRDAGVVRLAG